MAYACPVCATPQADGRHLANHLAFTAMIHGDDHAAWLADHAPGWEETGERDLAEQVIEFAPEIEFPPENAAGGIVGPGPREHADHDHNHAEHGPDQGHSRGEHGGYGSADGHGDQSDPDLDPGSADDRSREGSSADVTTGIDTDAGVGDTSDAEDERDVAAILAEARELTQRMRATEDAADGDPTGHDGTGDHETGDDATGSDDSRQDTTDERTTGDDTTGDEGDGNDRRDGREE
jgi:hypothetical protein